MRTESSEMSIEEVGHNTTGKVVVKLRLQEFLEYFTPPQAAKIVDGTNPDFDVHEAFDIPKGTSLSFRRKVNPNVSATCLESSASGSTSGATSDGQWKKVSLPVDFKERFTLLPFDPVSGNTSSDHIYHTVADLVCAFPLFVQANCTFGDKELEPNCSFHCGDRMKLIRLIFKDGVKFIECKLLPEPRLLHLPMTCVGEFTALTDGDTYVLADIVGMLPRRRRVQLTKDSSKQTGKLPGLLQNYTGDIFIEEPEAFIEASPVLNQSLIIGLPCDLNIMVSPDPSTFDRGILLNTFATQNKNLFPVIVRIGDWEEETAILENHYVKPGVEVVIHGWTRQSKVLAIVGDLHYTIPLTYTGKFRIKRKQYHGVSELERAYPGNKLLVLKVDQDDEYFPLKQGDIIKIKREDTLKRKSFTEVEIKCEKYEENGKLKEIKLPLMSTAVFEEYLEDAKNSYSIKELVSFVSDQDIMVELIAGSIDQSSMEKDLPKGTGILLCDFVIEPAVYVSVETPDAPAFHIPLRTLLYVIFTYQLEKSASPLLTKINPRLSTLDRCVELITSEVFNSLRPQRALENGHSSARASQNTTNGWRADGGSTTCWPAALGATREFDLLSGKARKPPSVAGSDMAVTKSKGLSKFKGKFKRYKSQENLCGGSVTSPSRSKSENVILADRNMAVVHNGQLRISTHDKYSKESIGGESSVDINGGGSQNTSSSYSPQSPASSGIPTHTVNAVIKPHPQQPKLLVPKIKQTRIPVKTVTIQNGINGHSVSPEPPKLPSSPPPNHAPPGYALVSMPKHADTGGATYGSYSSPPQSPPVSPGYMLVPVMSQDMLSNMQQMYRNHSVSSGADDEDDDYDSGVQDLALKKTKFKITIPPDGNLYQYSVKKMAEFLTIMRIDDRNIENCVKHKMDGKKFSRLEVEDLQKLGIMNPVVVHFRKLTNKKKPKFML